MAQIRCTARAEGAAATFESLPSDLIQRIAASLAPSTDGDCRRWVLHISLHINCPHIIQPALCMHGLRWLVTPSGKIWGPHAGCCPRTGLRTHASLSLCMSSGAVAGNTQWQDLGPACRMLPPHRLAHTCISLSVHEQRLAPAGPVTACAWCHGAATRRCASHARLGVTSACMRARSPR